MASLGAGFARILKLAGKAGLEETVEGTSYGTPALKVRDKSFMRMKEDDVAVFLLPPEQKEMLLELSPDIYFETEHYRGWPAVLVRLDLIGDDELMQRLRDSWSFKAPKRLVRSLEQRLDS